MIISFPRCLIDIPKQTLQMCDFADTVARKKMEALAQSLNSSKAERAKKMLVSAMSMQTNTAILVSVISLTHLYVLLCLSACLPVFVCFRRTRPKHAKSPRLSAAWTQPYGGRCWS